MQSFRFAKSFIQNLHNFSFYSKSAQSLRECQIMAIRAETTAICFTSFCIATGLRGFVIFNGFSSGCGKPHLNDSICCFLSDPGLSTGPIYGSSSL